MSTIWEIIKRTDRRVLLMVGLLFLGVSYSGYKAISALSADEVSPEYRRSPPGAFAIPEVDTIVDSTKLSNPRLSDAAYESIQKSSTQVGKQIVNGTINAAKLRSLGMSRDDADVATIQARDYKYRWQKPVLDPEWSLNTVEDGTLVSLDRAVDYSVSGSTLTTYINMSYLGDINGNWKLIGLSFENS